VFGTLEYRGKMHLFSPVQQRLAVSKGEKTCVILLLEASEKSDRDKETGEGQRSLFTGTLRFWF